MTRTFCAPIMGPDPRSMPPPISWVRLTKWYATPDTASSAAASTQLTAYPTLPATSEPPPMPSNLVLLRLILHRSWRGYLLSRRRGCRMTRLDYDVTPVIRGSLTAVAHPADPDRRAP